MILRNKKTGEIVDGECFTDIVKKLHDRGDDLCRAPLLSLDLFTEYWEEIDGYRPKEPLIKDKKIRKAVRAVADITGVSMLFYEYNEYNEMIELSDMNGQILIFKSKKLPVKDKDSYTISELCGEEEV